jgi:hypothetical protein
MVRKSALVRNAERGGEKAGTPANKPDVTNLRNCEDDARRAALDSDAGPSDPTNYSQLRGRLEACREKLPPLYREAVYNPYAAKLNELGPSGFNQVLIDDPNRYGAAGLMLDIAHAILQNGEGYQERATDAFQEVISDLYDGFLSAEDREGVKEPDEGVIPPLAKWGRPDFGPYTWPFDATQIFDVETAIVNLPPANARLGLFAWAALGHETAGHDILSADRGLKAELTKAVRKALEDQNIGKGLPEYWSSRIDETASDVLGILNMGPAAGIGIVGYFRGLNEAFGGKAILRSEGPDDDPHPADIVRGYLAASTVSLLSFEGAAEWAKIIEAETDKDASTIILAGVVISNGEAKKSASITARTIAKAKMESLESHGLGEIQDWRNRDEKIVNDLRSLLTTANQMPTRYATGIYAAHMVAAAVTAALSPGADIPILFDRMLGGLKVMHDGNPSWGPLYVMHPGDLVSLKAYVRAGSDS